MFMAKKEENVWSFFLLSFLIPIIGGIVVYLMKREQNNDLAKINLILSIFHPIIIGSIAAFFVAAFGDAIPYFPFFIVLEFFAVLVINGTFKENKYRYFSIPFYFSLLGLIYCYYGPYKEDENMRDEVVSFIISLIILLVLLSIILSTIMASWVSIFVSSELNKTQNAGEMTCSGIITVDARIYQGKGYATVEVASTSVGLKDWKGYIYYDDTSKNEYVNLSDSAIILSTGDARTFNFTNSSANPRTLNISAGNCPDASRVAGINIEE
jgi:hypothetical protein